MQVVATSYSIPLEFCIHARAGSDNTGRRGLALDLPAGSILRTDAGYTDYAAEDIFHEASSGQSCRKNSKRTHHPAQSFLLLLQQAEECAFV